MMFTALPRLRVGVTDHVSAFVVFSSSSSSSGSTSSPSPVLPRRFLEDPPPACRIASGGTRLGRPTTPGGTTMDRATETGGVGGGAGFDAVTKHLCKTLDVGRWAGGPSVPTPPSRSFEDVVVAVVGVAGVGGGLASARHRATNWMVCMDRLDCTASASSVCARSAYCGCAMAPRTRDRSHSVSVSPWRIRWLCVTRPLRSSMATTRGNGIGAPWARPCCSRKSRSRAMLVGPSTGRKRNCGCCCGCGSNGGWKARITSAVRRPS